MIFIILLQYGKNLSEIMYKHSDSLERKSIRKKEKAVRVICILFLLAFFATCELNVVNLYLNVITQEH